MTILKILQFPNPRLRMVATPIQHIDDALRQTMQSMYETMYAHRGVGLAATQVNIHQRFFTMDISEKSNQPLCVINPEITHQEGMQYDYHGCLSVGHNISDKIKRAAFVELRGLDLDGNPICWQLEGTAAICVQHEIDHLNGKLFIDHLSHLKQQRIREKLEKLQRS